MWSEVRVVWVHKRLWGPRFARTLLDAHASASKPLFRMAVEINFDDVLDLFRQQSRAGRLRYACVELQGPGVGSGEGALAFKDTPTSRTAKPCGHCNLHQTLRHVGGSALFRYLLRYLGHSIACMHGRKTWADHSACSTLCCSQFENGCVDFRILRHDIYNILPRRPYYKVLFPK